MPRSRIPIPPLRFTFPRAPTVEPDPNSSTVQTPSHIQSVSTADEDKEFEKFTPTIAANSGTLTLDEQFRAFLNLCYAVPAITEGEITQFVDRMSTNKTATLRDMVVKSSSSLAGRKSLCGLALLTRRAATIPPENGVLRRSNCPTCKEGDASLDFCFHLEFVPGVYHGPSRASKKDNIAFDITQPFVILPVDGQTNPKRYKLVRHS